MMRKFTVCLMTCITMLVVISCNDNDVSSPPKSNLSVDKTSGLANETVFTFTIDEAPGAGTVSLLPYGTAGQSYGGSQVVAAFVNGKATIQFTYAQVGKFDAVVVTNNHSADGKSVKNVYSAPVTVTITSEKNQITDFSFDKISTKTTIDQSAHTISVDVPYKTDLTALKATFTADPFVKVSVAGAAQESTKTANNYTSPVTYTVTSQDGTVNTYLVTVNSAASNNDFSYKSFTGKETSKATNGFILNSAIATSGTDIILYDVYGSTAASWDSVQLEYALNNPFGALHLGSSTGKLKQDTQVSLNTPQQIKIAAQDSASVTHTFNLHPAQAPLLTLATSDPNISTTSVNTGFSILLKALKGTVTGSIVDDVIFDITTPGSVTVTGITLYDADNTGGVSVPVNGMHDINFNDAVKIILHVTDSSIGGGLTYDVTYTAGLTELK